MRDSQFCSIPSYYIETLFYNELMNDDFIDMICKRSRTSSQPSYSNTTIFIQVFSLYPYIFEGNPIDKII